MTDCARDMPVARPCPVIYWRHSKRESAGFSPSGRAHARGSDGAALTGKSRGFGFVTFAEEAPVKKLLLNRVHSLNVSA